MMLRPRTAALLWLMIWGKLKIENFQLRIFSFTAAATRSGMGLESGGVPDHSVPRQLQFHVGAPPRFVELTAHVVGLLALALGAEGLFEAKQAPAVARPAFDVLP